MDTNPILLERSERGGRFVMALPGGAEAEMTFRLRDGNTIVIEHTGVPPKFEGHGIAKKLVYAGVEAAQQNGWMVDPVCSYVDLQFRRHRDWDHLRAA